MGEGSGHGLGRVGLNFLSAIASRVGSGSTFRRVGRVGSKKSDSWTTLCTRLRMALHTFSGSQARTGPEEHREISGKPVAIKNIILTLQQRRGVVATPL